ncbi:MAG: tRNA (adenosine(37)-N6)-threonylcarbamoyltransferase complex ATPase subunit type 1 TsaE [Acutalibacteraceae bacterium]|nr:tRNA (adenosine(37)-N6)-threonylcarbamoyltransferase complex ATPase subunit type 1 TsaE [Acutalibacteraceae bacterium]
MIRFISNSENDTKNLAEKIAEKLNPNDFIALFGGMGMGKTTFTRHLAKALGFDGEASSPTFAIINEYNGGRLPVYHFDMYRIETFDDLYSTNFFEYCEMGGVVVCEWSENIENVLPDNYIKISISQGENENQRIFEIEGLEL